MLLTFACAVLLYPPGLSNPGEQLFVQNTDTITAPAAESGDTLTNKSSLIIKNITIEGNKVTKERIILRELSFTVKDTILPGQLNKKLLTSRQNLLNTSLFNFVTITPIINGDAIDINVSLIERWYTWPVPVFELAETNFNTWWLTRDLRRTNYGLFITRENFRGRKEELRVKAQFGYTEQFALQYNVPYVNKKQTVGLGATVSYSGNHEITYKTVDNKRIFFRDIEKYVREEFYARLVMNIRKGIYNTGTFHLRYSFANIEDTITHLSDDYFQKNSTQTQFFTLGYNFRRDKRDFKAYPLKGYYFDIEAVKIGVDILPNSPDVLYFRGALKKFWKLNDRFFYAASAKGKVSANTSQPYYFQRGLGYGDLVRGYEYYIIDGQNWYLAQSNLKYQLVSPRVQKIDFIPSEKFNTFHYAVYLNLFADAGYVQDKLYAQLNPLANALMLGYGIGLDYVTYYDQVLRLEYSFNKLGERGFFINFTAPI